MSKGISINVGLNATTSEFFTTVPLHACENDAKEMYRLAICNGFDPSLSKLLLGANATFDSVVAAVQAAATQLVAGDLFLFSFAGHGTSDLVENALGDSDQRDESIVLTDHLLVDNFWHSDLWPRFAEGVRALAIADCCHAETSLSEIIANVNESVGPLDLEVASSDLLDQPATRRLSVEERDKELKQFKEFYEAQAQPAEDPIKVRRLFLAACKAKQDALDGPQFGAFTQVLLEVWEKGKFNGDYNDLIAQIETRFVDSGQTPNLSPDDDHDFRAQRPFTI